jgi:cellulose synthase/poly-beta-1,6-N-acetylglucosamine synthase-like glycosyltransferase
VERYRALGFPIRYLHRDDREGYKAGALAGRPGIATGEFIAIFDADFLPARIFCAARCPISTDPRSPWCRRAGPI